MNLTINLVIIAITVLVSVGSFGDQGLKQRLLLYPYAMRGTTEWYRIITSGFIHADWVHLLVNMFVLYSFGQTVESWFVYMFPSMGRLLFVIFYIVAIAVANISTVVKHRNNPGYGSLGASGAVSAVLFASIICVPGMSVQFIFIPIPIPGYIFGPLYVLYSMAMARRGRDQINHEAHLYGAIFGFVVVSIIGPEYFKAFLDYFANLL